MLPTSSILKVIGLLLLLYVAAKLMTLLVLIYLGLLLAVAMTPLVEKMKKRGIPRGVTITLLSCAWAGAIVAAGFIIIPSVFTQLAALIRDLPNLQNSILGHIPADSPFKKLVEKILHNSQMPDPQQIFNHTMLIVTKTVEGLGEFVLVLVFSIYLLIDRNRAYRWIRDFFSATTRQKMEQTASETSEIIFGYVIAQLVTSVLSAIYVTTVMTFLQVPAALVLGVIAGIFDVVPVLGFFIALAPALFLALTISPTTALLTAGAYLLYHWAENYWIIPYIYGNRMKVSPLVVLIALLAAWQVGGILGAIAVLPLVASYPAIERIWLSDYLGTRVVQKHDAEPFKNSS